MLKNTFSLLLLLYSCIAFSQGEANNWYFGSEAAIRFNNGIPEVLNDSAMRGSETSAYHF